MKIFRKFCLVLLISAFAIISSFTQDQQGGKTPPKDKTPRVKVETEKNDREQQERQRQEEEKRKERERNKPQG